MQNISTFKSFSKKKLRKGKPVGANNSHEKRKDIVSNADSKILNEQIGELDNEFNKLSKPKMRFAVDTILVIYFLGIMIVVIYFCYQKVMKK